MEESNGVFPPFNVVQLTTRASHTVVGNLLPFSERCHVSWKKLACLHFCDFISGTHIFVSNCCRCFIQFIKIWKRSCGIQRSLFSLHVVSRQVNEINLREASHDDAINVLRQTPQRVRLVVYRDEAQYKEEDLWDSFTIELHKKPGQGLGLSIVGRRWGALIISVRTVNLIFQLVVNNCMNVVVSMQVAGSEVTISAF